MLEPSKKHIIRMQFKAQSASCMPIKCIDLGNQIVKLFFTLHFISKASRRYNISPREGLAQCKNRKPKGLESSTLQHHQGRDQQSPAVFK